MRRVIYALFYSPLFSSYCSGLPPSDGFTAEPAILAGTLMSSCPSNGSILIASLASFADIIPVLTKAIQEQQSLIEENTNGYELLIKELEVIKKENMLLIKELDEIKKVLQENKNN